MRNQVMPWIDLLPNVNPSLVAQRDVVATKMALADDYMRCGGQRGCAEKPISTRCGWNVA